MPNALQDVLDSSPEKPQEPVIPEEVPQAPAVPEAPVTPEKPPKGFVPLDALHEERQKRQALEQELEQIKSSVPSEEEVLSDEGKVLSNKIKTLESDLSEVRSELTRERIIATHPILKEKWEEFEEFRLNPDNKGMNMRTAAKAFLVENGLLDAPRKGLEKTTGGPRIPLTSEMNAKEIDDLRKNDYKKYYSLLKKGQIKIG